MIIECNFRVLFMLIHSIKENCVHDAKSAKVKWFFLSEMVLFL